MNLKNIFVTLAVLCLISAYTFAQSCSEAFPFKQGTSFTMQHFDKKNKLTSSTKENIVKVTGNGNSVTANIDTESLDAKGKSISKNNFDLKCENGSLIFDSRKFSGGAMAEMPANANMEVKMSGDNFDMPTSVSVGQTLKDITYNISATMSGIKMFNMDIKIINRKVEAEENVTVPAGTYKCFKITYDIQAKGLMGKTRTMKTTLWFTKSVGTVKTESFNEKGDSMGYSVLAEFKN
jgi:hypothetical protein